MSATMNALLSQKIVVTCGSGGVGKTTIAASIALRGAQKGLRVLALTIDPARRLADSMGIELGNEPTEVPQDIQDKMGIPESGTLAAMMLDTKSTFDNMVHTLAPSPEVEQQIVNNRYYQQISRSMVGSQEYMAMVKLLDIFETGQYDLIVLDTPPSRHALDFLRAPSKLKDVLAEGALSWLIQRESSFLSRIGSSVANQMKTVLSKLEEVLGISVLSDLSEFVTSFQGVMAGFRDKAVRMDALLHAKHTRFVLVASPDRNSLDEAVYFYEQLKKSKMPFAGFVINRTLPLSQNRPPKDKVNALMGLEDEDWQGFFAKGAPPEDKKPLVPKLRERFEHILLLADMDRDNIRFLAQQCPGELGLVQIPELSEDVHDLQALQHMGDLLFSA